MRQAMRHLFEVNSLNQLARFGALHIVPHIVGVKTVQDVLALKL